MSWTSERVWSSSPPVRKGSVASHDHSDALREVVFDSGSNGDQFSCYACDNPFVSINGGGSATCDKCGAQYIVEAVFARVRCIGDEKAIKAVRDSLQRERVKLRE